MISRLSRGTPEAEAVAATAERLAEAARGAIRPWFRAAALTAQSKESDRFDPVTEADRAAERAMRDVLARERPDDAVRGEEYGQTSGTSGLTWVLDPVDGTRAFVCGAPTWGVLIAVCDDRGPIHGIIDQPHTGERWVAGLSPPRLFTPHGATALATRHGRSLADATLLSTFPEIGTDEERIAFQRVAAKVRLTRYGLDCYAYGLLAAGHVDLVIEAGLQDYDICAPIAIIEAAGGIVTDWEGNPAHGGGRVIAAASAPLHSVALALLSDAR